jgi:cell division protein FtsW (lipid II flippase)
MNDSNWLNKIVVIIALGIFLLIVLALLHPYILKAIQSFPNIDKVPQSSGWSEVQAPLTLEIPLISLIIALICLRRTKQ